MKSQMRLTRTSGPVGGLGGQPPRSTRPAKPPDADFLADRCSAAGKVRRCAATVSVRVFKDHDSAVAELLRCRINWVE
jgi:hypothetical protein